MDCRRGRKTTANALGVGKEELEQLKGRRTKEVQGHKGDLESTRGDEGEVRIQREKAES